MKPRRLISLFAVLLIILLGYLAVRYVHYRYPLRYEEIIVRYAEEYDVDKYLVMSVINAESRFNADAVSSQGAVGLMQITKPTAEWIARSMGDKNFGTDDLYDPETNIRMGVWYIDNLRKEFSDNTLILAAYNAGRGHVNGWLDDKAVSQDGEVLDKIPFKETEKYIEKVLSDIKIYELLY